MKIRLGFVSNSSSMSFILYKNKNNNLDSEPSVNLLNLIDYISNNNENFEFKKLNINELKNLISKYKQYGFLNKEDYNNIIKIIDLKLDNKKYEFYKIDIDQNLHDIFNWDKIIDENNFKILFKFTD